MIPWLTYREKFQAITPREQYLIIATGLVAIIFICFSLLIDDTWQSVAGLNKQIAQTKASNQNTLRSIELLEQALLDDPNEQLKQEIVQYQAKLGEVDQKLLTLTSDLIDPVQMRHALAKLLKLQKGVKIVSFQVLEAKPLKLTPLSDAAVNTKDNSRTGAEQPLANATLASNLHLYRHGIKITLQGQYFQLRDYLQQLENLSWKFFWQEFNYQLKEYPKSELEIELYSLSTAREFIGV